MASCFKSKMVSCFQLRVPLSLLFHALFILVLTEAKNIDDKAEGWAIPSVEKPLIIGVSLQTFSEQFVNVQPSIKNPDEKKYSGFWIDVFKEVMESLSPPYYQNYKFVGVNGTNDDLVNSVAEGALDVAVGDITIFAYHLKVVKITQSFVTSGMSLVIPMNLQTSNRLIFLSPFTKEVWLATWAILMYTMFIVWFMEHRSNPEFNGPWQDQLGNILWFTFSSLFFAHRERIQYNYTRVVVVLWFFVVLFVVQSYAANLSSILTVSQLPSVDSLKKSDALVGCFGNKVITDYLVKNEHFKKENIRDDIATQSQYVDALKSGTISAAFLQAPYAKVIDKQYCDQLTITGPTYELGRFGFVFQKGSPIADNVSAAILNLLEDGTISKLEDDYFTPSSDCSNFQSSKNNASLSLRNFSVLYLFYVVTSAICLLLFIIHSLNNQRRHYQAANIALFWRSVWNKILSLTPFLNYAVSINPVRSAQTSDHEPNYDIEMGQSSSGSVV